jgi:multiple sugar transport system substrate-binding protein
MFDAWHRVRSARDARPGDAVQRAGGEGDEEVGLHTGKFPGGRRFARRDLLRLGVGAATMALAGGLLSACGAGSPPLTPTPANAGSLLFYSTQFKPAEEAEKMRRAILGGFPGQVDYLPEDPEPYNDRLRAEARAGKLSISLLGGLHGDFASFARDGLLTDLTPLLSQLGDRNFPAALTALGRLGSADKQFYVPWLQATYVMAAHKQALPYLPTGASVETLTYAQLTEWGTNIQRATGQRRLGFPGGPKGLLSRFVQGYLYPSYARSAGVTEFRSPDAVRLWTDFRALWAVVHPQSTGFEFMQEPLQSGTVWVAWDHVARLVGALNERPDEFVAFPAPAGPRGRGFMSVIGGLAIPVGAPNRAGAERLIAYLTAPERQIAMLKELAFFPVTGVNIPADLVAGVQLEAMAVQRQAMAGDSLPALLPVGLGARGNDLNRVYLDTFTRIVLKAEPVQQVLDEQTPVLQAILNETGAPCWSPDPPGNGPCTVK